MITALQTSTGSLWGGPIAMGAAGALFFGAVWAAKRWGPAWMRPTEPVDDEPTFDEPILPDDDPDEVEDHGSFQISRDGENYTDVRRKPWQ